MTGKLDDKGTPPVGFVGIGNMGWPMAARLVAAGFTVQVADGQPARADTFAQQVGGTAADGLPALAGASEFLITMLPTSAAVGAVLDAVLPHLRPGAIVLDMISGEPAATRNSPPASPRPAAPWWTPRSPAVSRGRAPVSSPSWRAVATRPSSARARR